MEVEIKTILFQQDHVGCFGDFNPTDLICRNHCALRIRCAIEREQSSRLEILEEIAFAEMVPTKIQ